MNVAPKLLQERLGHERIQTTLDTYGHLYPNAQAEVARKLAAFMTEG
jgi:integrase